MSAGPVLRLLLVAALLSACADGTDSPAGSPAVQPSTSVPTSTPSPDPMSTSPIPRPSTAVPPSSTGPSPTTLTGPVEAGVEPGCVLLTSGGTTYVLLGTREVPDSGTTLTVTGSPAPGLRTTCQQGTPFLVTSTG